MNTKLISEKAIQARLKELAQEIDRDYAGQEPVLICNLKGAFMVMADLVRYLTIPVRCDFISYTSYRGDKSTGSVRKNLDVSEPINKRPVIIIEDIIDTGQTAAALTESLGKHDPSEISILSLIYRDDSRKPRYAGFKIEKGFVFGYGLDYDGRYRQLRDIWLKGDQ